MLLPKYAHLEEPERYVVLLDEIQDINPYYITLPEPPKMEDITNFKLPKEEQFFKRLFIPPAVRKLNLVTRDEARAICEKNADIAKFVKMCWKKRAEGEWQFINGKPYYINGNYWWYLNFYYLPHGQLPDFRIYNLKYFWFRNFVVCQNPSVWGSLMFTTRQVGKSSMAGGEELEYVTRTGSCHCGILSKDEISAREFFRKYIVSPRRKLIWFFQPIFDGNTAPKEEINFTYPSKKGQDADFNFDEEPLESKIDIKALTTASYDSETLHRVTVDEPGKYTNVSVVQLWDRLKYALRTSNGKANFITTIEELVRNGGAEFQMLWDNSNTKTLNELGETVSGLVPYFIPAYEALIVDNFGESIVNKPTEQQQKYLYSFYKKKGYEDNIAKTLSHIGGKEKIELEKQEIKDSWQRIAYTRKHPVTIREGFISSFKNCHFNLSKIEAQLEKFVFGSPYILRRGNFEWLDNKQDSTVIFREDDNGRWLVSYLQPQEKSNKWRWKGQQRHPEPNGSYTGVDPYRFAKTIDAKGSMGAIYTWTEYNEEIDKDKDNEDWLTDDFTIEYINRPLSQDEFFEDIILQCVYTNSKAYIEKNATDAYLKYFTQRGYEGFLKYELQAKRDGKRIVVDEKSTPGVYNAGNESLKGKMFNEMDWYVNYCVAHCKFTRLLNQLKEVEYEDLQPYDAFVGASLARINANMITKKPMLQPRLSQKTEKPNFPTYKASIY